MRLNIFLFILILILWNIMGCIGIYSLKILAAQGIIPGSPEYPYLSYALLYQLLFVVITILSFSFFKKKRAQLGVVPYIPCLSKEYSLSGKINYILLVIILLNNLIIIMNAGLVLLSGDYQSRFEMGVSVIQIAYIPHICWGIFVLNLYQMNLSIKSIINKYGLLISLSALLSVLNATRGFVFLIVVSLGWYFLYIKKIKLSLKFGLRFFLCFLIIYIGGQLVNVFRTSGFIFESTDILKTFSEDSFNEIRSFATMIKDQHLYSLNAEPLIYVADFIARLFPSFVFDIFGLNRVDYWNQSWESISYHIWGKNEVLYGLRFGLVGDIYIYMGSLFVILFAILYGKILTINNRYTILIITYAIYSIPYGALSFSFLVIIIFLSKLIRFIYK